MTSVAQRAGSERFPDLAILDLRSSILGLVFIPHFRSSILYLPSSTSSALRVLFPLTRFPGRLGRRTGEHFGRRVRRSADRE